MKRIIGIMLIVASAVMLSWAGYAENEAQCVANAVCIDEESIYLLNEGTLWKVDALLNKKEIIHRFDEKNVSGISAVDGMVYFCYQGDDLAHFATLDIDSEKITDIFSVETQRPLCKMLVHENIIYALWEYRLPELMERNYTYMCVAAAYDSQGNEIALPFDEAADILPMEPFGLMVSTETNDAQNCYMVYQPETGRTQNMGMEGFACSMAAGPDGQLYARNIESICRFDDLESNPVILSMEKMTAAHVRLICTPEALIEYSCQGELNARIFPLRGEEKSRKLTLINFYNIQNPRLDSAVKQFQQLHPDVAVVFEEMDEEMLKTAILAQDDNLDVVYVQNELDPYTLVEEDVLCNLEQEPCLSKLLRGYVAEQSMCLNGVRYGVPVEIFWDAGFRVNEKWAAYAPEVDLKNCDWLELYEMAEEFDPDLNGDGHPDVSFLYASAANPQWFRQYEATFQSRDEINFDTELFRTLAEAYKHCYQSGNIQMNDPEVAVFIEDGGFSVVPLEKNPSLTLNGQRVQIVTATFLCTFNSSAQHDLAVEFLELYCSDEAEAANYSIGLRTDSSVYPLYADLSDGDRELVEQQKEYLHESVSSAVYDFSYEFALYAPDQMKKYLNDEITLDELVTNLQKKMNMVRMG